MNSQWADYLDSYKSQFATVFFLQRGYRRFGEVTSNGVENINSALLEARGLPIVDMIEEILSYQQK